MPTAISWFGLDENDIVKAMAANLGHTLATVFETALAADVYQNLFRKPPHVFTKPRFPLTSVMHVVLEPVSDIRSLPNLIHFVVRTNCTQAPIARAFRYSECIQWLRVHRLTGRLWHALNDCRAFLISRR